MSDPKSDSKKRPVGIQDDGDHSMGVKDSDDDGTGAKRLKPNSPASRAVTGSPAHLTLSNADSKQAAIHATGLGTDSIHMKSVLNAIATAPSGSTLHFSIGADRSVAAINFGALTIHSPVISQQAALGTYNDCHLRFTCI